MNGKRTNKNPFLIPDRVLIGQGEVGGGLIPNVFFPEENIDPQNSDGRLRRFKCEILWGKEDERIKYAETLFTKIMLDLYENDKSNDYENIFCAYVPYAKAYTYKQILFSKDNKYPAMFFGIREDDVIFPENYLPKAASFLYHEVKKEYQDALLKYTNERDTFSRIDKDFQNTFVVGTLVPILNEYIEREHPLGLRVRELIKGELSRIPQILCGEMDERKIKYYNLLKRATSNYFMALEKAQDEKYL